jgi:hypothetical protein
LAQAAEGEKAAEDSERKGGKPEKREPGKLPPRPSSAAATSREAAADMLKKFFHNR